MLSSMCLNFFFLQWSVGTSLQTWTSTKALWFVSDCPSQCSLGTPRSWPRKAGNGLWVTARFTVGVKVYLPITWHRGRQDSPWVPWHMMWGPTAPSKALLPVDGCWLFCCWGGREDKNEGYLWNHHINISAPTLTNKQTNKLLKQRIKR